MNWNSNVLWGIIGVVAGVIVALIFFLIGKKRQILTYKFNTVCLISNKVSKIDSLEIKYGSKTIDDLYHSTITIKNIGNTIIEEHDFAPSKPLSILTDGQFIPSNIEIEVFDESVNFHLLFNKDDAGVNLNKCIANFDYIPKKSKIIWSIFHTGNIDIGGALKDGRIIDEKVIKSRNRFVVQDLPSIVVATLIIAFFLVFVVTSAISHIL